MVNANKRNIVPNTKIEVNRPISFHLLLYLRPQFGHASADLLISFPQSLHFINEAIF